MGRRVFVTGLGVVTPHGQNVRDVFARVYGGESAIRIVRSGNDDLGSDVLLAPAPFETGDRIPKAQKVFMARAAEMAVTAAHDALADSGLLEEDRGPLHAGIHMGCGLGGSEILQEGYRTYFVRRSRKGRPSTVPLIMANGPASHISMRFGIQGPAHTYSIACASSSVALGEAFRSIRDGYLECSLAGGAEAMLNDGTVAAWERLGVVATEHPDGAAASSRPFDLERTGFVLGEGAVVFVLESETAVNARGAAPVAEIIGYGAASDARALTEPDADGQVRAMRDALLDAGIAAEEVGYVNAHATGTHNGDPVEVEALKTVFGEHARSLAVSSTKSVHGHLVGASGALEGALTALALRERKIPPTANLTRPDPACDLDCVPVEGRAAPDLDVAISNSFAFGGSNATLVLRRVPES